MRCESCDRETRDRISSPAQPYHFKMSGLSNVFLIGIEVSTCPKCNSEYPTIPAMEFLLRGLALEILKKKFLGTRAMWTDEPGQEYMNSSSVVRFYDYFGYQLAAEREWAPDHLATELEFMHYLVFRESHATGHEAELSLRLAQRDFLSRHPLLWLPALRAAIEDRAESSYYPSLFNALQLFLEADHGWLTAQTAESRGEG